MRSALVNDTTNIIENIIVASPVTPSPFEGLFMIGLEDPVYEEETVTIVDTFPEGTTYYVDVDDSIIVILPDGTKKVFPGNTKVITNDDGTITVVATTTNQIIINPGTPCGIGWIYNPVTGTFYAP